LVADSHRWAQAAGPLRARIRKRGRATGSQIAGCSSAIEPIFSPITYRKDNTGSYKIDHEKADKNYFRCAIDPEDKGREVHWKQHVEMQSAFQKHIDGSIAKTINMSNSVTKEDVAEAMKMAWKNECKGITVFRDGCKSEQVLNTTDKKTVSRVVEDRPKELSADIFKRRSMDIDWHFIVGKHNDKPYEVFALNGKVDLPKSGKVIRKKAKHYSLVDDDGNVLVETIVEQEKDIDPRVAHETRRFSMDLRNGISPSEIVEQIDKVQNDHMHSFSKVAARIFKQEYLTDEDIAVMAASKICPVCLEHGDTIALVPGVGRCFQCPKCGDSRCV
jgi:ribonucleoside-diphosphate reductase alpha chain